MENETIENFFDINKIRLIVGLGNLGREYDRTRHNIGFEFVETLAGTTKFNDDSKLKSMLFSKDINDRKVLLSKPTTLMNTSGEAVVLISNYFSIQTEEILVVHDDLDLRIGNSKIQFAKGPKVHNGVLSIENRLGSSKFWRLRIGIDNREIATRDLIEPHNYVLSRFKTDELDTISRVIYDIIQSWIK